MGNILRELREMRGISQQKCAEDTGISLRTWQRYERDGFGCLEYLKRIAEYFGVTIDELEKGSVNTKIG